MNILQIKIVNGKWKRKKSTLNEIEIECKTSYGNKEWRVELKSLLLVCL